MKVIKFLIMQSYAGCYHFPSLWSKYSLQHFATFSENLIAVIKL